MKHLATPRTLIEKRTSEWQEHEFYKSAVVLGIDIGLEGIGIYLRRGPNEVFARTLEFHLPEPEALAARRQKRASRHCRKNRATRLYRLKLLFAEHGFPWLSEDQLSRTNPYFQRHRAITTGVASPEALSICIRHCVAHRGFDYGGTEEGAFPWGESPAFSAANEWLSTAFVTEDLAEKLVALTPELSATRNVEEQANRYKELISERLEWAKQHDMPALLAAHSKGGHDNLRLRARGYNFPRQYVWAHLEEIIRKHSRFFKDVEGFIAALGVDPNKAKDEKTATRARKRAIFFYNRKTVFDMKRLWDSKVKTCEYARRLGLSNPDLKCDLKEDISVRRWGILEFAATRRLELELSEKKGKAKDSRKILHRLGETTVKGLVGLVERHDAWLQRKPGVSEPIKKEAEELILQDIGANADKKARKVSQKTSDWNKSFYTQLWDLLFPTLKNRKKRSSMSGESATVLFNIATADATDFTPENIVGRLKAVGFYDWRRDPGADFNPYPQVECLLGRRIKRGARTGELSESHQGLLRRVFQEYAQELKGAVAPDYCVLEVIGDPPRNTLQKEERTRQMEERRAERAKRFEQYNLDDQGIGSKRRRVDLHFQQHGRCPYTGLALPSNPLDPSLEIEHVFPEELGGLSTDENLVLTWRAVNAAKGKRTPLQAAEGGEVVRIDGQETRFLPWNGMLSNTADMKWSGKKRAIFGWGTVREGRQEEESHYNPDGSLRVPDFGNTTRVAQLARQLRAEIARWMKVDTNPDEAARRIGTPSGWLSAQARKSWLPSQTYQKVRSNLVHHLVDAAVVSHIPPREGMNHVICGGVFYTKWEPVRDESSGQTTYRLLTEALPGLSPVGRLKSWLGTNSDYPQCPVMRLRSHSKTQPLGDASFWRQVSPTDKAVAQRTKLEATEVGDAEDLLSTLRRMRANYNKQTGEVEDKLPSRDAVRRWLDAKTAFASGKSERDPGPLRLTDGTPVNSIWKFGEKRNLGTPLGWSGRRRSDGRFEELRILTVIYDRVELWLGYDHVVAERERKKKNRYWEREGWRYQTRLIPDFCALKHLKQLGFAFRRGDKPAPDYMQWKGGERRTVREIVLGGKLLAFSKRMEKCIRRGDLLHLRLNKDGEILTDETNAYYTGWYRVTSTASIVKMKHAVIKDGKDLEMPAGVSNGVLTRKTGRPDVLAHLVGLPPAHEKAAQLGLRIPVRKPETLRPETKARGSGVKPLRDDKSLDLGI